MAKGVTSAILLVLLCTYIVISILVLTLGIWLRTHESYHVTLFGEEVIHSTSIGLIVTGSFFISTAILGCLQACFRSTSRSFQILLSSLLMLALFTLIVSGSVLVHMKESVSSSLEKVVSDNLKEYYGFKSKLTNALDSLQIQDECCGVNTSLIYQSSKWYAKMTRARKPTVPDSCCVRNPGGSFWNLTTCREPVSSDAQIAIYQKGCCTSIRTTIEHLLYGAIVSIFTIATITILITFGIFIKGSD